MLGKDTPPQQISSGRKIVLKTTSNKHFKRILFMVLDLAWTVFGCKILGVFTLILVEITLSPSENTLDKILCRLPDPSQAILPTAE
jgi:hypothetical protein